MGCQEIKIPEDTFPCCEPLSSAKAKFTLIPKNKQAMGYMRKKLRESGNLIDADWVQKMVDKGTLIVQYP